MAISTDNQEYKYARKQADELLYRSFRGITSSSTAEETRFLSPALCSVSAEFFITQEGLTAETYVRSSSSSSSSWDNNVGTRREPTSSGESFESAVVPTLQESLHDHLQRIEHEVGGGRMNPSILGPFHALALRRYPVLPKQRASKKDNVNKDWVETVEQLTNLIFHSNTQGMSTNEMNAKEQFHKFGSSIPKKVCQHPFKRNDIVWVCRTCQSDETCVLCHKCFENSNHEGHDVAFYHAQAGGCCDCGDPDAWDPKGFCPLHGKDVAISLDKSMELRVEAVVESCVNYLKQFSQNVERGYRRANSQTSGTARSGKRKYERSRSVMAVDGERSRFAVDDSHAENTERELHRYNTLAVDDHDYSRTRGMDQILSSYSSGVMDTSLRTLEMTSDHSMDLETNFEEEVESSLVEDANDSDGDYRNDEECKFDPRAASTSKSRTLQNSSHNSSVCSAGADGPPYQDFDPEAASTSKSLSYVKKRELSGSMTPAQRLGHLGCQQDGLFLVLHADDVHKPLEVSDALRKLYNSHPLRNHGSLDSICNKIVNIFQQDIGDIILWGTYELMNELGPVLSLCWKDNDEIACTRFGALMIEKAKLLTDCGMVVSIKTRHELCSEVRCAAILEFLNLMSGSCDPLCQLVSVGLGAKDAAENDERNEEGDKEKSNSVSLKENYTDRRAAITHTLRLMLLNDLRLPRKIAKSWHDLLLTLLAVPNFKAALANAYVDTYASVTSEYARGIGIFEKSAYTLSVQFLNRVIYVEDLVKERDLMGCLIRSLFGTLAVARKSGLSFVKGPKLVTATAPYSSTIDNMLDFHSMVLSFSDATDVENNELVQQVTTTRINTVLDTQHSVLSQRRYGPCVSDLKCVLNVPGVARLFASLPISKLDKYKETKLIARPCLLDAWINLLSICQNMDLQRWRRREEGHVEQEPRDWVGAFNAGIAIGSLYERLLNWEDEDEHIDSPLFHEFKKSNIFLTAAELTHYILVNGIDSWQCAEALNYVAVINHNLPEESCSHCLPIASVACNRGTLTAMKALPISQCDLWSFHIPLHRFVAFCIREVARRRPCNDRNGQTQDITNLLATMIQKEDSQKLFRIFSGLLEYPLMIIARNSQIRSDLWLRNGRGMFDQVLNYAEPHFCKGLRDADLSLMQFAFIGLSNLRVQHSRESDRTYLQQPFSCAHFVNLCLHRFGIFDYAGFKRAPDVYKMRYVDEVKNGLLPPEKQLDEVESFLPVSFPPSDDPVRLKSMLEEILHTFIMFITELPAPPPLNAAAETQQAKTRLRREVIHRLASGPKAHSELAEIHHVLSMRDNMVLSEEGKLVNPDDANGAALEAALVEVADCKSFQGRSDTWELQRWAWNEYDPAFFHLSTAQHQNASELRPSSTNSEGCVITPMPYAPFPPAAHSSFVRLRRDITSDSCVVAMIYRALHVHCRTISGNDEFFHNIDVKEQQAYMSTSLSETVLGRAIHLLTLGAYAWETELSSSRENWKTYGGGDTGSVFHEFMQAPTQRDWVEKVLLAHPEELMDSSSYSGEKNCLQLLRVLVTDGGSELFKVQDKSIRCGAAWLCEYATRISPAAASLLGNHKLTERTSGVTDNLETHYQRRSREAKERALKLMQAQMAKFANALDINDSDGNSDHANTSVSAESEVPNSPNCLSDGNGSSGRVTPATADTKVDFMYDGLENGPGFPDLEKQFDFKIDKQSHDSDVKTDKQSHDSVKRLLDERPRCIICADDGLLGKEDAQDGLGNDDENKAKKKILAWCGYIQASTVAKGVGGLPSGDITLDAQLVGIHISVCGHAIHQSCCEAHSKDSLRREGDIYDRYDWRGEFKCPLCRRISNCLVPFIDVGKSWAENVVEKLSTERFRSLHDFLSKTRWWATRNDRAVIWNGRCSFVPNNVANDRHSSGSTCAAFGKKDLCKAWGHVLCSPPTALRISNQQTYLWAQTSAAVTAVYRKILDQVSEISYKADSNRTGEENLQHNLGEFRHYLVEKVAYNEGHKDYGATSQTEWPSCIFPAPTPEKRQALSREKLIAKHLLAIQALTYSCCSEIMECVRLAKNSTASNLGSICAKFGVQRFTCNGRYLVLPPSSGKGVQIFDGKIGRLRYLALALMVASSPISREVVHMNMNLPSSRESRIATDQESFVKRAPIVYPILHSHILTHVVATICAICGQERTRHEAISTAQSILPSLIPTLGTGPDADALNECIPFIQLGYLARTLQVLLGTLCNSLSGEWSSLESQIIFILHVLNANDTLSPWERGCLLLLRTAVSSRSNETYELDIDGDNYQYVSLFSKTCLHARELCKEYVYNIGIIFQIILPRSVELFQNMEGAQKVRREEIDELLHIFGIQYLEPILDSPLLAEIIEYWYEQARKTESDGLVKSLNSYPLFRIHDWPHLQQEPTCIETKAPSSRQTKKCLPLLGSYLKIAHESLLHDTKNRITSLPISYTDLYAKLGTMLPDCELTAVCFVCGEVLDAGGKGECTRHTHKCGAGCGIFFLLQECVCLGMHRDTAAFITSPYVDSHGETPQYRGRPLNMDESRYEFLHELWSGHLLREYVIAERSKSMRNLWIANNFY